MPAVARISSSYRLRLGGMTLVLLAAAAWFAYDGWVAYPAEQRRYETFVELRERHPVDWAERWQQHAAEHGWSAEQPKSHSDNDILIQKLIAGICLAGTLLVGGLYLHAGRRWIAADEQGLRTHAGKHAEWSQIQRVLTERWKRKGIADVLYENQGGRGRITLDDWKYDQDATVQIFDELRTRRPDLFPGERTAVETDADTDAQSQS